MRKHYLDNLRTICVFALFPYHAAMVWNAFGEQFYVWGGDSIALTAFLGVLYPVFMPLMFAIAGISAKLSLDKRTPAQFIKERVLRLLIPALLGIPLLIPMQTFYAERFHNGYTGGYFEQYSMFFGRFASGSGYDGGFGSGHLWFIVYLFVISLVALGIILAVKKLPRRAHKGGKSLALPLVILLFIIPALLTPLGEISGKSIGKYLSLFLLGYYVLSNDAISEKLEQRRWLLFASFAVTNLAYIALFAFCGFRAGVLYNMAVSLVGWLGILAFIGLARHKLNFTNKALSCLSTSSFPVYILHQSLLIAVAYYVVTYMNALPVAVKFLLVTVLSLIVTMAAYELVRRIPVVRGIFGIKAGKVNPWQRIPLEDYENHMKLASVKQLQAMNELMRSQLSSCDARTAMVLGVAGGNGLEHVDTAKYNRLYGVDVNRAYLNACKQRYPKLAGVFVPVCLDVSRDAARLPKAELVIANLFIEYIGVECFGRALAAVQPKYVSCAIQVDVGEGFVSDSPYLHTFDGLNSVHRQIEQEELTSAMNELGYSLCGQEKSALPNGKALQRLDYIKQ